MKAKLNLSRLPVVSADDQDWLIRCEQLAAERQEFRLIRVATKGQIEQAVQLIVRNRLWIEACDDGFLVTRF